MQKKYNFILLAFMTGIKAYSKNNRQVSLVCYLLEYALYTIIF